jgi:hypothetical protein
MADVDKVLGKNTEQILTGQVPPWPECEGHRETAHDADGALVYCNRCGWNRPLKIRLGRPNGGWA